MITYTWDIFRLDCAPSENGLTDVVKTIHWILQGQDENRITASMSNSYPLPSPSPEAFSDYSTLTKETVISWLESNLDVGYLHTYLANEIVSKYNPPITPLPLPWVKVEEPIVVEEEVVVTEEPIVVEEPVVEPIVEEVVEEPVVEPVVEEVVEEPVVEPIVEEVVVTEEPIVVEEPVVEEVVEEPAPVEPTLEELIADGYNPDARDGDGDGLVQDGTEWERPIDTNINPVDFLIN
jgi:hypothetical protein